MLKKINVWGLLFLSTITFAQEKVLLRLNYEKGTSYTIDMKMSQIMGGGLMTNDTNIIMNQMITESNSDTYNATFKFDKMTMYMMQAGMKMSYDSSKEASDLDENEKIMKSKIDPLLNTNVFVKGNHLGKVLETSIEPDIPEANDYADNFSIVYPENKVAVGDTWKVSKKKNGLNMNFEYKVKSIESNKVVLDIGGKVSGIGEGDINGDVSINRKSGIPIESKIDMIVKIQGQDLKTNMIVTYAKN